MEHDDEETKFCSNCKRDISASNYVMHKVHCERNIVLCKKCNEPVPRSQMEEHHEEYHVMVPCECGQSFEKEELEEHKESGCRLRKISCQFCELELAFEKMAEHSNFCGSRTEKCEKCGHFVKLRDQTMHKLNGCQAAPQGQMKMKVNNNPFILGGSPYQQLGIEGMAFEFPREDLLSDVSEPVPREPFFRQTVMEELDSDAMIGQRRSKKNETTQRHNSKNERTAQARSGSVDEDNGAHSSHGKQVEEDLLLALRLAHEEVEADGTSLHPRLRHTSTDLTPEELYPHVLASLAKGTQDRVQENFVKPPSPPDPTGTDKVEIPCEICNRLIPLETLEMHQTQCLQMEVDVDPSTRQSSSPDSDEELSHPFGGHLMGSVLESPVGGNSPLNNLGPLPVHAPHMNLVDDVASVAGNERNGDGRPGRSPIPDAEVCLVPCEFCRDQFPFVSIALHQAACDNAPQNRQIQDDMREYGFNDRGGGIDEPDAPHRLLTEEQSGVAALPLSELIQGTAPSSYQQNQSSRDSAPQDRQILDDMREYGFNDHGGQIDDPAHSYGASADWPSGVAAMPLSELNRVTAQPNHQQNPDISRSDRSELPDDVIDHMLDLRIHQFPNRTSSKEPVAPVPRRTNPLEHSTHHQKPANHSLDKQDNGFSGAVDARNAQAHIVKARTVPAPERVPLPKDPEPRRRMKHQADPFSDHLGTGNQTKGPRVNFVSHQKTLDVLQKPGLNKPQNKGYGCSQSFSGNDKNFNRQVLQPSPNSAFVPPTAKVVSTEKTLNMQRKLRNGGPQNQKFSSANGVPADARANGGFDCPNRLTSDTKGYQFLRPDGPRKLKTVDMLTETRPRGNGPQMTSSNPRGHLTKKADPTTSSGKVSNAEVAAKAKKSDVTSRGVGQRSQREAANSGACNGRDMNPDKNSFELSSQVIRATRCKASSGLSRAMRDQDSEQRKSDSSLGRNGPIGREKQENGFGSDVDLPANYSWQGMFSAAPVDRTVNNKLKHEERSGESGPQKQSFTKNGMKMSSRSTKEQNHPRRPAPGSASSVDLSPSDPLPASFQSALSKKENGDITGGKEQSKDGARPAPKPMMNVEEDFANKMISGTQAFMSSNSNSRSGKGRSGREPPTSQDASTDDRDGEATGPRCSANFGDSRLQQGRGHNRVRRGHRGHQDRTEQHRTERK